jgi:hypothetical protein
MPSGLGGGVVLICVPLLNRSGVGLVRTVRLGESREQVEVPQNSHSFGVSFCGLRTVG